MAAAGTLENTILSMALLVVLADMPSDTAGACHVNRVGVDVSHISENGQKDSEYPMGSARVPAICRIPVVICRS